MKNLKDRRREEVPVYLFTGFLDAGKTKFIQGTLEDKRFNSGERTLILLCEEGEEEYDFRRIDGRNIFVRTVENESELKPKFLRELEDELYIERVIVEYNGMWMIDSFYRNMPSNWVVEQEMLFAEYGSFAAYNSNMRQLVFDKLQSCEMVVFNRAPKGCATEELHKIVRGVNRRCAIAFEHPDGSVDLDDTEDSLPFDLEAPVVDIDDKDYALWYSDMSDEAAKYEGKTVCFKGQYSDERGIPEGDLVLGRKLINCCAADMIFAGLIVENAPKGKHYAGEWLKLKAKINFKYHPAYGRKGPVLLCEELEKAEAPEYEVATFY